MQDGDLESGEPAEAEASPLKDFFMTPDVLIFLGMVVLWHFSNAPMLPTVGYKIQQNYEADPDNSEVIQ